MRLKSILFNYDDKLSVIYGKCSKAFDDMSKLYSFTSSQSQLVCSTPKITSSKFLRRFPFKDIYFNFSCNLLGLNTDNLHLSNFRDIRCSKLPICSIHISYRFERSWSVRINSFISTFSNCFLNTSINFCSFADNIFN